jgi:ribosomal protein S11
MTTADLTKIEALISVLGKAGFETAADQLREAVHQTAYANATEMFGEIAVAVRAAMHLVGPEPAEEIASALSQARDEIVKILPHSRF